MTLDARIPVVCPSCKATNRVDPTRLGQGAPVCGRCRTKLEPRAPGYPVPVDDKSFDREVVRAGLPVLVDFWAEWCGPCRQMEPILEEYAYESAGRVRVVQCNVDQSRYTAQKYGVKAIPTLILFRGLEAGRIPGAVPLEAIRTFVGRYVRED